MVMYTINGGIMSLGGGIMGKTSLMGKFISLFMQKGFYELCGIFCACAPPPPQVSYAPLPPISYKADAIT